MSNRNQVTLTFAGDESDLTSSFDRVGASSREMSTEVDSASSSVRSSGESFDRLGQSADAVDSRAMGFRDTVTGLTDSFKGLTDSSMPLGERLLTLGMGVGDLASGFANFLIPAAKNMTRATIANTKSWIANTAATVKNRAATVAHTVASKASRGATMAMTAAQKALNVVMRANPIGLVITALAAVGAALVAAYNKSETFRNIVNGAFNAVKNVAESVWGAIESGARNLGRVFSSVADAITGPFKRAFEGIKNTWNSSVGGKGFTVPDWVPGVGGKEFRIPTLHTGGVMGGAPGTAGLALLQAGERVTPAAHSQGSTVIEVRSGGSKFDDLLVDVLRQSIRSRGGDVQLALGAR